MQEPGRAEDHDALAQAQEMISRQAQEIADLRRRLAAAESAETLREALGLAATTGAIAAPISYSRLLEMIVETAAYVIKARAASLFLIDEQARELVFEVALGQKAEEAKKFRVPLGHGIAGLVAATGQPMAISDAQSDPRHAREIAESIGYMPQSILCVPLFSHDQVIGVLELLDKEGASSFSAADMEALSLFANQAAVAIEQSRTHRDLVALITEALRASGGLHDQQPVQERVRALVAGVEEDAAYHRALDLAALVQEIAEEGENETKACQAILRGFVEYLRSRPQPMQGLGGLR